MLPIFIGGKMKKFILQEKTFDYGWFDLYENNSLDYIKQVLEIFESKYFDRTYRIVEVMSWEDLL